MSRSILQPNRSSATWLACLLFAILAVPLNAQVASRSHLQTQSRFGYDKAHEITLNGTIQSVVSHSAPGAPAGLHLIVAGPQGAVDAHLGPYLSKDIQQSLHSGMPVQIVGATERIHGKSYLLAREVIVDGRTITVRSANGFLVFGQGKSRPKTENSSRMEIDGGAR